MGSESSSLPPSRRSSMLMAVWIFGCAVYYYASFSAAFIRENETALQRAFPRAAQILFSQPAER